jgi:ABC-type transport system involved in multi-copper enzyme maturation permease subunit
MVLLPRVNRTTAGVRAHLHQLFAALGVEFRLLLSERGLVVIIPLAIFLPILEVAFYNIAPDVSYSAAYATNTAKSLLLFLIGITIFYTGEAMHRDREVRIEPVLWATPAPNHVLLLSKCLATLSLTLSLTVLVGLTAIVIQFLRSHPPIEIHAYLITYSVILLPGMFFVTAVSAVLNVLLRDKYLAYAVSIGSGAGLFYLYSQGHYHWLYNPLLYQLWKYADLTGAGNNQGIILMHRLYCLAVAALCLSVAHLVFQRTSTKGFSVDGRLSAAGWSSLTAVVSVVVVVVTSLFIISTAR